MKSSTGALRPEPRERPRGCEDGEEGGSESTGRREGEQKIETWTGRDRDRQLRSSPHPHPLPPYFLTQTQRAAPTFKDILLHFLRAREAARIKVRRIKRHAHIVLRQKTWGGSGSRSRSGWAGAGSGAGTLTSGLRPLSGAETTRGSEQKDPGRFYRQNLLEEEGGGT